jgi:hypothetical protein
LAWELIYVRVGVSILGFDAEFFGPAPRQRWLAREKGLGRAIRAELKGMSDAEASQRYSGRTNIAITPANGVRRGVELSAAGGQRQRLPQSKLNQEEVEK